MNTKSHRQDDVLEEMAGEVRAAIRAEHARGRFGVAGWALTAAVLAGALIWWLWPTKEEIVWQRHVVDRGDMLLTATATGNLEPKSEITVGAEISGLIIEVLVAENDPVARGDVLARFDTEELLVNMEQANARLALAQASVAENEATLAEALVNEQRTEDVLERGLASAADMDGDRAARQRAEARVTYARATVREARATVSVAETRLSKAVIAAPIDGVVLQRNVEPGNAVAANFQTPQLFLLAEDLDEMELHVSLDEADVALVRAGQPATFTVDAWPDEAFDAEVLKVYLYPTVENNVVTYVTVLNADNSDGRLQPGMTATATITTGARSQIVRVPNSALRFKPPSDEGSGMTFGPPGMNSGRKLEPVGNTVWILRDGEPQRVIIRTGYTDGRHTEVLSDELNAGDEILIGVGAGPG
ncbi:MAG: efflux RND transporter periplasmic adaptor subunit [Gammaproteobacteria bacterium]|nr:efflux RND transporter periplasmic adaptor subunit [Gammaproteobacteria bacterium]